MSLTDTTCQQSSNDVLSRFPVWVDCPKLDEAIWVTYLDDISSHLVAGGTQYFEVKSKAEGETFCPVQDRVIIWNTYVLQGGTSKIANWWTIFLLTKESRSMFIIKFH